MKIPDCIPVYGDTSYRGSCPIESAEQITFFNNLPEKIRVIAIHPRNEGKRSMAQAQKHKAEGMTPGASDIIVPGAPTFVCELKRKDHTKSKMEEHQLPYLIACKEAGAFVCIALGWQAAMEALSVWSTIKMTKNG